MRGRLCLHNGGKLQRSLPQIMFLDLACHYCLPQDMNALKCVSGLEGLRLNDVLVFRRRPSMPGVIADQLQLTGTVSGDRLSEVALSSAALSSCLSILVAIELA